MSPSTTPLGTTPDEAASSYSGPHPGGGLSSFLTPSLRSKISLETPFLFHEPFGPHPLNPYLEPYLPLSSSLILTPPRPGDLEPQVECLNDPRVGLQLIGPPSPYTHEMAREWATMRYKDTIKFFQQWIEDEGEGESREVRRKELDKSSLLPFASIREEESGDWIGEIGITRWEFREVENVEERERLVKENQERKVGDDELVLSFGYFLSPSYQGQGIMTLVLSTIFSEIFSPSYLNASIVRCSAFEDNVGSIRVQEKCGLKRTGAKFWHEVSQGRGGGRRREVVLEWRRDQV